MQNASAASTFRWIRKNTFICIPDKLNYHEKFRCCVKMGVKELFIITMTFLGLKHPVHARYARILGVSFFREIYLDREISRIIAIKTKQSGWPSICVFLTLSQQKKNIQNASAASTFRWIRKNTFICIPDKLNYHEKFRCCVKMGVKELFIITMTFLGLKHPVHARYARILGVSFFREIYLDREISRIIAIKTKQSGWPSICVFLTLIQQKKNI